MKQSTTPNYALIVPVLAILLPLSFSSCFNFFQSRPPASTGSISLFFNGATRETSRVVAPVFDMAITKYDLSGSGPEGGAFSSTGLETANYTKDGLALGDWTFTVDARNADGIRVGTGFTTVTIASGQDASGTVVVRPLEGNGEGLVTVTWSAGLFSSPRIAASIEHPDGSSDNSDLSIGTGGLSATFHSTSLAAGYHFISLTVLDGSEERVWRQEYLRIIKDQVTSLAYSFGSSDIVLGIAKPKFSLAAGTYSGSQTGIVLSTATPSVAIYYTNNGTLPSKGNGTLYSTPLSLGSSQILRAIALRDGLADSAVASASYTITGSVATPRFSPPPGIYYDPVTVSIGSPTSGAIFLFTLDGSAFGEFAGSLYSVPITISAATTIKTLAKLDGLTISDPTAGSYLVTGHVSAPVFSVAAGTYSQDQSVTAQCSTSGAAIYYTTDGSAPSPTHGTLYASPLAVAVSTTLKAAAFKTDWDPSPVTSATYTLKCANPVPDVAAGTFNAAQTVSLSSASPGTSIHYSSDGTTTPSATTGSAYSTALAISQNTRLQAVASKAGWSDSDVAVLDYYLKCLAPTFSLAAGSYMDPSVSITMSSASSGTNIAYTLNGTSPNGTTIGTFGGTVTLDSSKTVTAIAVKTGWTNSDPASATYTLGVTSTSPAQGPAVSSATPSFDWADTAGATAYRFQISTASDFTTTVTDDATLTSSAYTQGTLLLDGTSYYWRIMPKRAESWGSWSSTVSFSTGFPAAVAPTFSPVAGTFSSNQSVTISTTTPDATIYYTIGDATPTALSSTYSGPIAVAGDGTTKTIHAMAKSATSSFSSVASGIFTIDYSATSTPSFSPFAGNFTTDQSITISCSTAGATIYYTLDGSTPTTGSSVYTGAISAAGHGTSTTLKAIAISSGTALSAVESGTYAVSYLTAATPSFSPLAGNKTTDTDVTISCTTPGAKIYYTTDGSAPTTASQLYAGAAIRVAGHGSTKTIKALATATCFLTSLVGTGSYTINYPAAATPSFGVAGGTYTSAQSVTISTTTSGATIYYTTDGTVPTSSSAVYSSAVSLGGTATTKTLKAIAISATTAASSTASAAYIFNYPAAVAPTFSPAAGTYSSAQSVSISTTTGSATIYYTTDGTAPTTSSSVYSSAVSLGGNGTTKTLKAIAISPTTSSSATAIAAYTFNYPLAATPTFSPVAGTYASDQSIALTTTTPNATIYYTTNNTTPTSSSAVYSTPISIAGHGTSMVIQAKAISATTSLSSAASGTFTIAYPAAATPTFNPPGGVYTSTQSVTISSTTAGATIWYTTDGSDPTSSATRLSGASPVASVSAPLGKTLRAEATAIGYSTSAEGTANYQPPLLTMLPVAGGSFNNGTSLVTVSSFTMSTYEITQAQYLTVTGNSPSFFSTVTGSPVEQVTWYDAVEFCNKLSTRESRTPVYTISGRTPATGYPITSASVTATWTNNGYRLPTEAEWEYAARGGASTHGYVYAGSSTIDGVAWYSTNSASKTHAVGGKTANELGLYDMSGNLWEWCWDWYGAYPSGTQTNPTGATTGSYRVKRGGSWNYSTSNCAVSYRDYGNPSIRYSDIGFRVVAPPSP